MEDVAPDLAPALDEALAHGVVVLAGEAVMFRHELARLTVLDEIPALRRRALHRNVLTWLEAHDGEPSRMAFHADAAGQAEAARAHALVAAGRATTLGSHTEAAEQYRRALRHSVRSGR